jgi:antitoxin ParD1/3/4
MLEPVIEEPAMHISLPPDLDRFVQDAVASGRYRSADEVLQAAVRLLRERDERQREQAAKLAALRADIGEGIASIERGEGIDGEEFFAKLRTEFPLPGDP